MKTSKLPPELVEKMYKSIYGSGPDAEELAQIAVDYVDEVRKEAYKWHEFYLLQQHEAIEAIKQRDELLGALRNLVNKHGDNHLTTWITKEINEAKQLLKKHEDGKE